MKKKFLYGRGAYPGTAEGIALVCPSSLSGNSGGVGDTDGIIYELVNPNVGECIKGRVLVIPCGKGSNGFSAHFKSASLAGFSPAAWIVLHIDSRVAGAVASTQRPCVSDFKNGNPLEEIHNGDLVRVDGSTGTVTILLTED